MKNIALYLMLLIAAPATAQSGLFGSHSHHHSHVPAGHHHGSLMHYGPGEHPYTIQVMNTEDFEVALDYLSKKTFDSDRLEMAKEIVGRNCVSAKQIASVCKLFTYDSNRLEFAKFAYASCADKGMYFILDETFTFNSSRDELHKYISKY